jgi:hypothetical protein
LKTAAIISRFFTAKAEDLRESLGRFLNRLATTSCGGK